MHDPFRAHEAYRRATDILFSSSAVDEKGALVIDVSKVRPEVTRKDKMIALKTIQECFEGRRRVNHWFPVMEQMMHLIIELSADLDVFQTIALRCLEHYKKITQMNNANSLHEVVSKFLAKIKTRLQESIEIHMEEAAEAADASDFALEKLLRTCAWEQRHDSGSLEASVEQKRSAELTARRQLIAFYNKSFDVYRSLLYRFRGNLKLSTLFQNTIRQCAQLMLDYCTEWQKIPVSGDTQSAGLPWIKGNLQELLRVTRRHLDRLYRSAGADRSQNITPKEMEIRRMCFGSTDIYYGYIETWFKLFEIAKAADLWHEAYIAVEAVNYTLSDIFSRLPPRSAYIMRYYDALGDVFWASNNCNSSGNAQPQYLFHAYALMNLWKHYQRHASGVSSEQAEFFRALPGRILLATCCVHSSEIDCNDEGFESEGFVHTRAMSASGGAYSQNWIRLLALKHKPSLIGLFRSIQTYDILGHCANESALVEFYKNLRGSQSNNRVGFLRQTLGMIEALESTPEYQRYLAPIRTNLTQSVLGTVFRCYRSIRLETMRSLCCVNSNLDLEPMLLSAANEFRNKKITIEIDQAKGECVIQSRSEDDLLQSVLSRTRSAVVQIRSTLGRRSASTREALLERVKGGVASERAAMLARLDIVERRTSAQFFEKEAQRKKRMQEKQQKENEQQKIAAQQLEKERVQRENRKKQDEEEESARARINDIISQLEKVTGTAMPEIRAIADRCDVLAAATARLHKEQHRIECEAIEEVNRFDFFIREKREQQREKVHDFWNKKHELLTETAEERQANLEANRKEIEAAITQTQERLERMRISKNRWERQILQGRKQAHDHTMKKRTDEQRIMEELMRGAAAMED